MFAAFIQEYNSVPVSIQVGSNPSSSPRHYYVYNGHGDVVNLADASGNIYASYSYDEFGVLLTSSESFLGALSSPQAYRCPPNRVTFTYRLGASSMRC